MNKAEREVIDSVLYWRSIERMEKFLKERAPKEIKRGALNRMAAAADALQQKQAGQTARQLTEWIVKGMPR